MKLFRSKLVVVQQAMMRWASEGTWLSLAAAFFVAARGWLDPFGLRQRPDWMVADQFLRFRHALTLHSDILIVANDDGSVREPPFPVPRSDWFSLDEDKNQLTLVTFFPPDNSAFSPPPFAHFSPLSG